MALYELQGITMDLSSLKTLHVFTFCSVFKTSREVISKISPDWEAIFPQPSCSTAVADR